MGKVKAFFMDMEEDAKTMTEKDFVNKYGEQYQYIWRNEQIWIESKKNKNDNPDEGHEMWEGGG
jgi:hypothetical protein